MEEKVDLIGRDAQHRLLLADEALLSHVGCNADCGLGGALAVTGLEQPQLALLHRELHVLHLAIMPLELRGDVAELAEGLRHFVLQLHQIVRRANAGHDIFALGVDEVVALDLGDTRRPIARHGDAGRRVAAQVAEHHHLDVDGRAEVVGDTCRVAVVDGAPPVPRAEDGLDGEPQLLLGIVGEPGRDAAETLDDLTQVVDGEIAVAGDVAVAPELGQHLLEQLVAMAEHDRPEHLDEPAVRVVGEMLVAALRGETLHHLGIQTDVENGVHHARHRELGAGTA